MTFPNYSPLFTLGLSSSSFGQSKSAKRDRAPGRCRPRQHALKSFLKLETRIESTPLKPALALIPPTIHISSLASHPTTSRHQPEPQMCHWLKQSIRSIPLYEASLSTEVPKAPGSSLTPPPLSPSTSPASAVSTLPPGTPPANTWAITQSTISSISHRPIRQTVPARKSSTTLGPGHGLTRDKSARHANRVSLAASSVASTHRRRVQRSVALANLEGRSRALSSECQSRNIPLPHNFMSMSDEDDDEEHQPRSAPVSASVRLNASHHHSCRFRTTQSNASSVIDSVDFLDFRSSVAFTTMTMSVSDESDTGSAEDGFRALEAALCAALGASRPRSQTFSDLSDVSV